MPAYERLAASEYVIGSYAQAAELWQQFEDFGKDAQLRRVAVLLCETLGRLGGDEEFWGATFETIRETGDEAAAVNEVLADLREFRGIEEGILVNSGVPPAQASRLASELITAIRVAKELPSGDTVLALRARVEALGAGICEVAAADHAEPPRWRRRLAKGMRVLGGAAAIVVDGVTAPALPITLLSVGGGVLVITGEVIDE
jgi:hypothetical protein